MSLAKNKVIQNTAFQHKPEQKVGSGVMCSALIVAAPHSGSGKTTITAALARYHRDQGRKVTVFKVGPDFIDPMILRQASGVSIRFVACRGARLSSIASSSGYGI